jgi:hypothetical protein
VDGVGGEKGVGPTVVLCLTGFLWDAGG